MGLQVLPPAAFKPQFPREAPVGTEGGDAQRAGRTRGFAAGTGTLTKGQTPLAQLALVASITIPH